MRRCWWREKGDTCRFSSLGENQFYKIEHGDLEFEGGRFWMYMGDVPRGGAYFRICESTAAYPSLPS